MTRLRNIFSGCLLLVAVGCAVVVGGIVFTGGRWEIAGMSAANPTPRLVVGAAACAGFMLLRNGLPSGPRGWARAVGRIVLLGVSVWISVVAGEQLIRMHLRRTQGFDSLDHLKQFELGVYDKPRSSTPMVAVIRLSENRRLLYENRPGLDIQFDQNPVRTNQAGMREDRDYPVARIPGSVRILGIGDSGMFGWGVDQGNEYLGILEKLLNQRQDPVTFEVLNLAVPGYNTRQEVESLKARGLAYQPDVVILGWCLNDWSPPMFLYEQQSFDDRDFSYLWRFLFRRKQFFEHIAPQVVDRNRVDTELVDPMLLEDAGEDGVRRALAELRELAKAEGFKLLVFGPLRNHILAILDELDIDRVNTFDAIPRDTAPQNYRVHAMHPRTPGHARLGEVLTLALKERQWLDPEKGRASDVSAQGNSIRSR